MLNPTYMSIIREQSSCGVFKNYYWPRTATLISYVPVSLVIVFSATCMMDISRNIFPPLVLHEVIDMTAIVAQWAWADSYKLHYICI